MPTKDEEAVALAQKHYLVEPGMTQIFRITGGKLVAAGTMALPGQPASMRGVAK